MKPFKSLRSQLSFYDTIYDDLIPKDHLLYKLNQVIDWAFIEDECRPYYSELGRKGESPILLFKMLFLCYLYNISERRIEGECTYHFIYKYFIGLDPRKHAPDHSTLSKFRDRLGEEGFRRLFNRVVAAARDKGLVTDELRIIDATHQTANVDVLKALQREVPVEDEANWSSSQAIPGSPDKDARFGAKSKKKKFFGYKHHIGIDAKHGIITNSATSPGHMHDGDYLEEMIAGPKPQALTGDKIFDAEHQHKTLKKAKIKSLIIRKKPSKRLSRSPEYQQAVKKRRQVERVFAVQKRNHGGRRARYWGTVKTQIQNLITDMVYNFKIMAQVLPLSEGELCPEV